MISFLTKGGLNDFFPHKVEFEWFPSSQKGVFSKKRPILRLFQSKNLPHKLGADIQWVTKSDNSKINCQSFISFLTGTSDRLWQKSWPRYNIFTPSNTSKFIPLSKVFELSERKPDLGGPDDWGTRHWEKRREGDRWGAVAVKPTLEEAIRQKYLCFCS